MLLTIAERIAIGYDTHTQQVVALVHVESERYGSGPTGIGCKLLLLTVDDLLRQGIEQDETNSAFHSLVCLIGDGSSYLSMVAHPHKTRQIRRQHKLLRCNDRCFQLASQHIFGVGITTETPASQTLRHGESNGYFALLVSAQVRIEEGCFCKIGAKLGLSLRQSTCDERFFTIFFEHSCRYIFHFDRISTLFHSTSHGGISSFLSQYQAIFANGQNFANSGEISIEVVVCPRRYPLGIERKAKIEVGIGIAAGIAIAAIQTTAEIYIQ